MDRKKLFAIIMIFVAYSVLLFVISANYKKTTEKQGISDINEMTEQANVIVNSEIVAADINLLSSEVYGTAIVEGKTAVDTPWGSNIELLGDDYPEHGLFMMPGTSVGYTVQVPEGAKLLLSAKIYEAMAETGISDGITLVIEVIQDGASLISYEPILVTGDGKITSSEVDFTEWQGRAVQIKIHCYDGGKDDANGDWGVIKELQLTTR